MLVKAVVLCACAAVAFGALSVGPLEPKPEKYKHIEGCYIKELDQVIATGTAATSKENCLRYRCGPDAVQQATCGVYHLDEEKKKTCFLFQDKGKPYPDCCPQIKCKDQA